MSGQWLHGDEDSPQRSEERARINRAKAEAVLAFARDLEGVSMHDLDTVPIVVFARMFIQQQGWKLPQEEPRG
jgi:hypothetical protein